MHDPKFGVWALMAALIAPRTASAEDTSSFRIVEATLAGNQLEVTLAWQHVGSAQKVEFFVNKARPAHKSEDVRAGLPLTDFQMAEGAGQGSFKIELKTLKDKLGLTPGQEVFVSAAWPGISGAGSGAGG